MFDPHFCAVCGNSAQSPKQRAEKRLGWWGLTSEKSTMQILYLLLSLRPSLPCRRAKYVYVLKEFGMESSVLHALECAQYDSRCKMQPTSRMEGSAISIGRRISRSQSSCRLFRLGTFLHQPSHVFLHAEGLLRYVGGFLDVQTKQRSLQLKSEGMLCMALT